MHNFKWNIFPGHYTGRATHIHVVVTHTANETKSSQTVPSRGYIIAAPRTLSRSSSTRTLLVPSRRTHPTIRTPKN
ncbi:hypothetical protein AARAC_010425 [Aspergillus arachidicola]|uniref:Intradiol ring-cleavage dioxygenases domain-containing protein n=1 Tax=Aspergillus arachidicola TaxID=656916 RepID=A0A2G7G491_9EURO|nr:hypothetical protein AARAC_010425 [Aspergillus arachidicola]